MIKAAIPIVLISSCICCLVLYSQSQNELLLACYLDREAAELTHDEAGSRTK